MPDTVFSVHPHNPRCFIYRGKPFKILTSAEHYGAVLNADFDHDAYLEEMRRTGQNMTRVFTFYREKASSIPEPGRMNTLAPKPEAAVMPWERARGRGEAADGLNKFDLSRWNAAYFQRFKDFVALCDAHGIVCEVVLFCNPYDQSKYDLFPCSRLSNINGVGSDLDSPRLFMTLDAPSIAAFQERFVLKIVQELNPFDNVYYEICNEPNLYGQATLENEAKVVAWHAYHARIIRQTEDSLPKRHLIAANAHFVVTVRDDADCPIVRHEDDSYFASADIDIVNYHYISAKIATEGLSFARLPNEQARAGLIWPFLRRRDQYAKAIVFDETFSGIVRGAPERYAINRAEAWEMILSGGAGYDNLDWSFTPGDEAGRGQAPIADGRRLDGRCLREWLGILGRLLAQYDLAAMTPALGLLPAQVPGYGWAASQAGDGEYVLYFVDERLYRFEPCPAEKLSVALGLPPGQYSVQALDPRTGSIEALPVLASDGSVVLEVTFPEDVAILLRRRSSPRREETSMG